MVGLAGDDLQIGLFFIAIGVSMGLTAIQSVGRHKALVTSLWATAGIFTAIGFFWKLVKGFSPDPFIRFMGDLAERPLAYTVLFLILAFVLALRERGARRAAVAPQSAPQPARPPSPQVSLPAARSNPVRKYARPKEADEIDIASVPNKELAELVGDLSSAIGQMLIRTMRGGETERVALFKKNFAPAFLWLYEEARRRGHKNYDLDRYYDNPQSIVNVSHLNDRLKALSADLPLFADK